MSAQPATKTVTGLDPVELPYGVIAEAKRMMRKGVPLETAALVLGVRSRDLDLSLWRTIGGGGW